MPAVVTAIGTFLANVGLAAGYSGAVYGASIAIGASVLVAGTAAIAYGLKELVAIDMPDQDGSRDVTMRSTTEPVKIIYGEALVSGPISFLGVANTDNKDLYHAIALAGHEVDSIQSVYLDGNEITNAQIGGGAAGGGAVTAGTFGPVGDTPTTIAKINKHLGTSTQTADSDLSAAFTGYGSNHTGKGIAYMVTKFTLTDESQETWDKYSPQNIKALVRGAKLYDPRLEVADGGTAGASPTNASYIAYAPNPALAVSDYLMNAKYGMGMASSKVDWASVITAADVCDATVSVPGSATQKRFEVNGVVYGTAAHKENVDRILSSMNGQLVYSGGVFYVNAGAYIAPTVSLNEDSLAGPISVNTSFERTNRFNTMVSTYVDKDQAYTPSETTPVTITSALNRDNNEVLKRSIRLPMTNTSYGAQRISNKILQQSDQQKTVVMPCNLSAMNVKPGDRVQVTISDLSWSNKVFQVIGWGFADMGGNTGVELTLREDDSGSYADLEVGGYSTVSATGVISAGFPGIPAPTSLSATAGIRNIELNWTNPTESEQFQEVQVYASPDSSWTNAVRLGTGRFTSFIHDASTSADAISAGDQRYYWVRSARYGAGSGSGAVSDRLPDNDTSTVNATAGTNNPNFSDVVDNTGDQVSTGALTLEETTTLANDGTLLTAVKCSWAAPSSVTYIANYDLQYKKTSTYELDYGSVANAYTSTIDYGSVATATSLELDYGNVTDPISGTSTEFSSVLVYDRVHVITGLDPLEEYTIRVRAVTRTGTYSDWVTGTITTQGDQTAPGVPTSVTATGGFQQIELNWTLPSADDLDYIEIFESATDNVGAATSLVKTKSDNFTRTMLGNNVTRYYFLRSVDRSNNASGFTSSVYATTGYVGMDDLAQAVQDEFAAGNAFGIEPVSTLSGVTGDHVGQIKLLTTTDTLYVWTGSAWSTDIFTASNVDPGSITAASFASGIEPVSVVSSLPTVSGYTGPNVVFLTTDGKLYRLTGGAWTAAVPTTDITGTLDYDRFSSDLRPTEVVASLPSTGLYQGRVVLLTSDNKIYRYTGSAWTTAISATDLDDQLNLVTQVTGELPVANANSGLKNESITINSDGTLSGAGTGTATLAGMGAGALASLSTITATEISDDAIEAPAIKAGAILTDAIGASQIIGSKIAGGTITGSLIQANSLNANDLLVSGSITATQIQAGAVGVDELAANSVNSSKIVAGSIVASDVNVSSLFADSAVIGAIQSGSITTSAVVSAIGTFEFIQSSNIAANQITAGKLATSNLISYSAQISDGIITNAKIDTLNASKITAGTLSTSRLSIDGITLVNSGGNLVINTGGVGTVQIAGSAVTDSSYSEGSNTNITTTGSWVDLVTLNITIGVDCDVLAESTLFVQQTTSGLVYDGRYANYDVRITRQKTSGDTTEYLKMGVAGALVQGVNTNSMTLQDESASSAGYVYQYKLKVKANSFYLANTLRCLAPSIQLTVLKR
jgi:hypothetical protein